MDDVLAAVLARAGLWESLAALRDERRRDHLAIALKVDLGSEHPLFPARRAAAATSRRAVERLVDLLFEHGYGAVRVLLAGTNALGRADELGYTFETAAGRPYELVEVGEDLHVAAFPRDSPLEGAGLSRAWSEADVRLVFAKSATDGDDYYSLCARSLGELVVDARPEPLAALDVPSELLCCFAPTFAIVDAWESSHGPDGRTQPQPIATWTILASSDVLLCDWAAAFKMGLDPHASRINARALQTVGLPSHHRADGDLAPYASFVCPDPAYVEARRFGGSDLAIVDRFAAWLHELPYLAGATESDLREAAAYRSRVLLSLAAGTAKRAVEAYRLFSDKDQLPRQATGLGFDPSAFSLARYEDSARYFEPLEKLAAAARADDSGLRWCIVDGSVLVQYTRTLPVRFEEFASRVDVSRAVQLMNDYIGGASVVVARDDRGRATHQATRTIYLPQPNFQVFFGGKPIDVSKLQYSRYEDCEHKVYWQTICSRNDSAKYDDGSVSFRDLGEAGTQITIVARQEFAVPLFWQAIQIDMHAVLKRMLIEHAYRGYFARTIANFEAEFEGRSPRIGCVPGGDRTSGGSTSRQPGVEPWTRATAWALEQMRNALGVQSRRPALIDDTGFVHFERRPTERPPLLARGVPGAVAAFASDITEEMRKDFPWLPRLHSVRRRWRS